MVYKKSVFLIICVCTMYLFSGCGENDSGGNITATTDDVSSEADKNKTEEEIVENEDSRYTIGDTIYFQNGLEMTITDVGTYTDDSLNALGGVCVYIEVELYNNGDSSLDIYNSDMVFFADDYNLKGLSPVTNEDILYNTTVMQGRKARGRYYSPLITNYDEVNVIEGQIGNAVIIVKDESISNTASDSRGIVENSELEYGSYVLYLNNEYDGWCEMTIDYSTGDDADCIYISAYEGGNHETAYFYGNITSNGGAYSAYCEDTGCTITITKSDDGVIIDVTDNNSDTSNDAMSGEYLFQGEIDFSEVG